MVASASTLDPMFKTAYLNKDMTDLTLLDRPFTALMPHFTKWGGAALATTARGGLHIPLKYANPPSISQGSTGFTLVQQTAANTSSQLKAWDLLSQQTYGFVQITNEAVLRSESNMDAFVNAKTLEIDGLFSGIANRLEMYAFGAGDGVIAQVGNSTQQPSFATSVVVLADPETAMHIEIGDRLTVAATPTGSERTLGSGLTAGNSGLIVGAVDRDAGTFTVNNPSASAVNANDSTYGIPTIANGDYITHMGARGAAQTGFQGYIPATAPVAGVLLNNLDRSSDPTRLAGSRYDGSSDNPLEAIRRGDSKVSKNGGKIEQTFVNYKHYADCILNIQSRGMVDYVRVTSKENPKVGFSGVTIIGDKGEFDIVPAWACPSNLAAQIGTSSWLLCSVGDTVRFAGGDGLDVLRVSTSDNIECRVGSYSNFVTIDPRSNCNTTLAS